MNLPGKPDCCWNAGVPKTRYPRLSESGFADVAVIGAGIVGLTTAYQLAKAGLTVAVLEAGQVGRQVTGRSTAKITSQHSLIYRHLLKAHNENAVRCDGRCLILARFDCSLRGRNTSELRAKRKSVSRVQRDVIDPERSSGPFSIDGQVSVSDRLDFVGGTAWKLHSEL
jgi:monoamine oxidase